jgi:hypothetical protein
VHLFAILFEVQMLSTKFNIMAMGVISTFTLGQTGLIVDFNIQTIPIITAAVFPRFCGSDCAIL